MSRANETELALLKLIASSMVHIVGKEHVLFVTPYFVEYENGDMTNLRMPELDHPFIDYLGCSDDCKGYNENLWKKYHEVGRSRKPHSNPKIWEHILSLKSEGGEKSIKAKEIDLKALIEEKEHEEFHVHFHGETSVHTVLVSEVRQACNTLIAVISVTLCNADEAKLNDKKNALENYLGFLEKGKYLAIRQELNAAMMDVRKWREWRMEYKSNHWGDESRTFLSHYYDNTNESVRLIKKDYGLDFNKAIQPESHDGRPGLQDLVTIDPGNGRIRRVIENRLAALNRDRYCPYAVSVTVEGKYDYLWFNALAVADTLSHVVRTYSELPSSPGDRLWISETQGHNHFVNCTINIYGNDTNVTAVIAIHECGLVGTGIYEERGGNHLKSIIECATFAGARSILVRWFNPHSGEFEIRAISPTLEFSSVTSPPSLPKDLTGFFFEVKGEFLHDREKSFAAFLVTEPPL